MTLDELLRRTRDRVDCQQYGIPTYYDRRILRQAEEPDPVWLGRLERHRLAFAEGRFVPWSVRAGVSRIGLDVHRRSEVPDEVLIMSQGTSHPVRWRGHDLFKSAFDLALMPMLLAELRPATILEVGSGNGASAVWMADLMELHRLRCRILSVDIRRVTLARESVEYLTGDARDLEAVLPPCALARGPRLIVEDAHVGVGEVLEHVHDQLEQGDYILVEDSVGKSAELRAFTAAHPDAYAVDTLYTDFFGRNATSCVDSILRRMA